MKKILFLDTETIGLPKKMGARYDDLDNWPRIVQLAASVYTDGGKHLHSICYTIRPNRFEIPESVTAIHGISDDLAIECGYSLGYVLTEFLSLWLEVGLVVCHNCAFDIPIVAAEMLRCGSGATAEDFFNLPTFCTKEHGENICKIPKKENYYANGENYKFPSLDELYAHLFGCPIPGRETFHDAMTDVQSTARCYFAMKNIQP